MNLTLSKDHKYLIIKSCTQIEYNQLKISLNKKIKNWRFHPLVKSNKWDGVINILKKDKIPSGLWKEVIDVCKKYEFSINIENLPDLFDDSIKKEEVEEWIHDFFKDHPKFKDIREYQIDSVYKILKYRRSISELATSAGKTLISFIALCYIMYNKNNNNENKRVLMVVPSTDLVLQGTEDFEEYNNDKLTINIQQIYSGAEIKGNSNIVIGTYQSLVNKKEEFFKSFDAVLVDECHKANTKSIQKIMNMCNHCSYRIGLSGTLPKKGTLELISLMGTIGPVVNTIKAKTLQEEGYISHCKVNQYILSYASKKIRESFYNLSKNYDRSKLFTLEKNFIIENDKRLEWVSDKINSTDGNCLVLFHKLDYGEKLYNAIKEGGDKSVYYIDGSINKDNREDYKKRMENGENVIIVASYGTFSTGISINKIHNIFFTESYKAETIVRQSIGRGLRKHESKESVIIHDFVDDFRFNEGKGWSNYVYKHGLERRIIYKSEQFPYKIINVNILNI